MDMRHHRFGLRAIENLRERVYDIVFAKGPAVELVDALTDHHAGVLLDDLRELAGVVLLDRHDALRVSQDVADRLRGKRLHQTALQEVDLLALRLEHLERVEDGAFRRAPPEYGEVGVLRPVEEVLLLLGNRALRKLQLAHAFFHHRDAHLDHHDDVSAGAWTVTPY